MDAKLAKGLTRHGFRDDVRASDPLAQEGSDALIPLLKPFKQRGRLKKEEAKALIAKDAVLKGDPHYTVFMERFVNPKVKALSAAFDEALVGGAMMPGRWPLNEHDEKVQTFSLFYDRVRLVSFEHRFFECSVFLREHAISRFLERADGYYRGLAAALWPGLLLLELIDRAASNACASAFMLPSTKGAFLGMRVRETLPEGQRRTYSITISKEETQFLDLSQNSSSYPLMSFINTFVHTEELRSGQRRVCDETVALIEKHQAALMHALLSRTMLMNDENDDLALSARFPRYGLDAAVSDYRALVGSSAWRDALKLPDDGVFKKYVDMQRKQEAAVNT